MNEKRIEMTNQERKAAKQKRIEEELEVRVKYYQEATKHEEKEEASTKSAQKDDDPLF